MVGDEGRKRHIVLTLFAVIFFVLIIVSWTCYLFSLKKISQILDFQLTEATHYIIFEKRSGEASKILSVDDTQVVEEIENLEVRFLGPFWRIIRVEKSQKVYQVSFYKKGVGGYQNLGELGEIVIAENECIYVNGSKYKVLNKRLYYELLDLLKTEKAT